MKLENLVLKAATGEVDNSFIGIKIVDNVIEFHYPESFYLGDNEIDLRRNILKILKTVMLAKTTTKDLSSLNTKFQSNYVFPLKAFLWLINDYLTFGKYINREKIYEKGYKGRINWNKTIKQQPIISNGNIVYTNVISERKDQKDNDLTEIYRYCVYKAIEGIGWLYNLKNNFEDIKFFSKFNNTIKKKYVSILNAQIQKTFDDVKRVRLENMRNVLLGLDDHNCSSHEIVYGVDSYDQVFEKLVDKMFSNISNISDFYPSANWKLVFENQITKSSNLRPDTIFINNNNVYILDAKYYRYGTTFLKSDMPTTTSIQKQLTYGEFIKNAKSSNGYNNIFNAFILPFSKHKNKYKKQLGDVNFAYVGSAYALWTDTDESYKEVLAILVDMNYLIDNWMRHDEDNILAIVNLIENNIGEI